MLFPSQQLPPKGVLQPYVSLILGVAGHNKQDKFFTAAYQC